MIDGLRRRVRRKDLTPNCAQFGAIALKAVRLTPNPNLAQFLRRFAHTAAVRPRSAPPGARTAAQAPRRAIGVRYFVRKGHEILPFV